MVLQLGKPLDERDKVIKLGIRPDHPNIEDYLPTDSIQEPIGKLRLYTAEKEGRRLATSIQGKRIEDDDLDIFSEIMIETITRAILLNMVSTQSFDVGIKKHLFIWATSFVGELFRMMMKDQDRNRDGYGYG
ncbi:hypothetical protein L2E82_12543 [Cichorium intybus]|uniref:Uncharacterized protein n=1 Tax=Cichorium intybus TaxID=13427 RepID=A0ACB9GHK8_CICIN|nr:hypothetical protein L2E82_12543 [Cichorium intybus]